MGVKLRLTRRGKKKQPTYRVVAADSRFPRDGRFIEILGFYNPRSEPSEIRIDSEKALKWLHNGAQPSERVKKLLEVSGVWEEFTTGQPAPKPSAVEESPKLTIVESDRPEAEEAVGGQEEAKSGQEEAVDGQEEAKSGQEEAVDGEEKAEDGQEKEESEKEESQSE